jgi:TetR/AcrR family transcriptional regulator of autoinduction and epiphytic fitness
MEGTMATPKLSRKAQTEATRSRMLNAAYSLFCAHGYTATTMGSIAAAAGVAVQTVYFTFHTKAELMSEVVISTAGGPEAATPVPDRGWMTEVQNTQDGRRALALVVEHGVDIYQRMAPLSPAVRMAASVDEDVRRFWSHVTAERRASMRRMAVWLGELGQLRPELTVEEGGDVLAALQSHETFLSLVTESGWPILRYKAWLYRTLCCALLPDKVIGPVRNPTEGLSYEVELVSAGYAPRA